ncbi:hypothetical protein FXO38_14926 [Capsicum annuum]|nr:hypothetical protein FXO38_14926 [Capsicum annuum]
MIEESLNLCVGEGIRDNNATGGDEGLIKAPKVLADIVGLVMGSVYLDCAFDVNAFWVLDVSGRGAADVGRGSIGKSGRGGGASSSSHGAGVLINMDSQMQVVEQLVLDLRYPVRRERALLELSKVYSSHFKANIPSYLYAFLVTTSNSRPFEYLRLASLGVIGALVKADDRSYPCSSFTRDNSELLALDGHWM